MLPNLHGAEAVLGFLLVEGGYVFSLDGGMVGNVGGLNQAGGKLLEKLFAMLAK